jgi:hypothetical protein
LYATSKVKSNIVIISDIKFKRMETIVFHTLYTTEIDAMQEIILTPFLAAKCRETSRKNIEKISELEIDMMAPSHGPIYKNPTS